MYQRRSNCETGQRERSDRTGSDRWIRIRDIIQHGKPQNRVTESKNSTSDNWRPITDTAVGGEREPEKRDGEKPHRDKGCKESSFGTGPAASFRRI